MPTKKRKPRGEMNDLHIRILQALAKCELLTIPHFNKLKLCSERHLRDKLKDLKVGWGRALIKVAKSSGANGKKKPYYYHLTKHGKAVVARVGGLVFDRVKIP